MSQTVITLSTIPPRFDLIGKTLRSLVRQRHRADEIRLVIPRNYRRFGPAPDTMPSVPDRVTIMRTEDDLGPATKLLPTLAEFRGRGDTQIAFCDDDMAYPRFWLQSLIGAAHRHPGCCIARVGYQFANRPDLWSVSDPDLPEPRVGRVVKNAAYRLKRIASLALHKPAPIATSGYGDVFEGYGGVLLTPAMLPERAFDLPRGLWTVDDPLLSGFVRSTGTPLWIEGEPQWHPAPTRATNVRRLLHLMQDNRTREELDAAAIRWCQETLGVFTGVTPLERAERRRVHEAI